MTSLHEASPHARAHATTDTLSFSFPLGPLFMKALSLGVLAIMAIDIADWLDQDGMCAFCQGTGSMFAGWVGDIELHVPCFMCFGSGFDGHGGGPMNPPNH